MLQSETVRKYDTYKDSGIKWIGEIPKEWNTITLKRVFSNRDGGAWGEEPQNNENDRICIRIADFDYPKMTIKHDIDYTIRNYATDVIEKLTLQKNDILIEKSGGGDQTPVGRTIIFNEDFNALYANFMDRLRVKQSISPKFIQYLLVSFYQNGITYQYIKQTTGIQNLDLTNLLAKECIVLPILDEQQKIADYLDKKCGEIDRVVETEKLVIEKLKEYKQSIITEAVTKGLDKSVPLKDSGIEWIGKIPQHWDVLSLARIANIVRGASPRPAGDPMYFCGNFCPWITVAEVTKDDSKYIFETEEYLTELGVQHSKLIDENTFLLSNSGATLGVPKITKIKGCINDGSLAFLDISCNMDYLYYVLKSRTNEFRKQMQGYGQPNLNTTIVKAFKICLPSTNEQIQIAEYLDKKCSEIDKAIANKEQVIEKFTEYKKSLIYECVTGKKRVA